MANNVSITPGSGDSVAAEDISSVKYQKIKLVDATASSTSAIGVAANPLQVSLANTASNATAVKVDGSAVTQPVSGTVAVTNAGITTIAGAVAGTEMQVDIVTMPNVTNAGTFAVQSTDSVTSSTGITIKVAYTASQTGATVLTPTSGKKVVITDIVISASGAGTVYLFDNTDSSTTNICPTLSLAANGGWSSNFKKPWQSAAANNVIKYTSGSGAAGSIWIQYYEV